MTQPHEKPEIRDPAEECTRIDNLQKTECIQYWQEHRTELQQLALEQETQNAFQYASDILQSIGFSPKEAENVLNSDPDIKDLFINLAKDILKTYKEPLTLVKDPNLTHCYQTVYLYTRYIGLNDAYGVPVFEDQNGWRFTIREVNLIFKALANTNPEKLKEKLANRKAESDRREEMEANRGFRTAGEVDVYRAEIAARRMFWSDNGFMDEITKISDPFGKELSPNEFESWTKKCMEFVNDGAKDIAEMSIGEKNRGKIKDMNLSVILTVDDAMEKMRRGEDISEIIHQLQEFSAALSEQLIKYSFYDTLISGREVSRADIESNVNLGAYLGAIDFLTTLLGKYETQRMEEQVKSLRLMIGR